MLATQLHQEQEETHSSIAEEMRRDDEELKRAVERTDERNELILDLIRVSRKPGSGLLDPKVGFVLRLYCLHRRWVQLGPGAQKKDGEICRNSRGDPTV